MKHIRHQQGFSLVELTIVVVILGILATFAVPRFRTSVEKTKASEGLSYLHQVQVQQERFRATNGRYAKNKRELFQGMGEDLDSPNFFTQSAYSSSDWETRWAVRLTRDSASSGFGRYTIAWNQDGFVPKKSSISGELKSGGGGSAPLSSGNGPSGASKPKSKSKSLADGQDEDRREKKDKDKKKDRKKDGDKDKKDKKDDKKKDKDDKKKDKDDDDKDKDDKKKDKDDDDKDKDDD